MKALSIKAPFANNPLLQGVSGFYLIVWLALAISPVNRFDWILENLLVAVFLVVLVSTHRRFRFSDTSYVLMTLFMILHAIGAHYTYAEVPLGDWLKDALGLSRNHFDRIVHFAFGLLMAYPLRELLMRSASVRRPWTYVLTFATVLALSGGFEVVESWITQIVSPDSGDAYLGTQGDIWDAQEDMTAAMLGAVGGLTIIGVGERSSVSVSQRPAPGVVAEALRRRGYRAHL